ncbi:unnamed protein product, partial [Chrysoparadoxa australica]
MLQSSNTNPQVVFPDDVRVQTVACGGQHTIAVTTRLHGRGNSSQSSSSNNAKGFEEGSTVYEWGLLAAPHCMGDKHSPSNTAPQYRKQLTPQLVKGEALSGRIIQQVACGRGHSVALDAQGTVYMRRAEEDAFTLIATGGLLASLVACGSDHTLILAEGRVLASGSNTHAQLGLGHLDTSHSAQLVTGLKGQHIVSICAGGNSSGAISDAGLLWCWGDNRAGNLGLGIRGSPVKTPQPVVAASELGVCRAAMGGLHTLITTERSQRPSPAICREILASASRTLQQRDMRFTQSSPSPPLAAGHTQAREWLFHQSLTSSGDWHTAAPTLAHFLKASGGQPWLDEGEQGQQEMLALSLEAKNISELQAWTPSPQGYAGHLGTRQSAEFGPLLDKSVPMEEMGLCGGKPFLTSNVSNGLNGSNGSQASPAWNEESTPEPESPAAPQLLKEDSCGELDHWTRGEYLSLDESESPRWQDNQGSSYACSEGGCSQAAADAGTTGSLALEVEAQEIGEAAKHSRQQGGSYTSLPGREDLPSRTSSTPYPQIKRPVTSRGHASRPASSNSIRVFYQHECSTGLETSQTRPATAQPRYRAGSYQHPRAHGAFASSIASPPTLKRHIHSAGYTQRTSSPRRVASRLIKAARPFASASGTLVAFSPQPKRDILPAGGKHRKSSGTICSCNYSCAPCRVQQLNLTLSDEYRSHVHRPKRPRGGNHSGYRCHRGGREQQAAWSSSHSPRQSCRHRQRKDQSKTDDSK